MKLSKYNNNKIKKDAKLKNGDQKLYTEYQIFEFHSNETLDIYAFQKMCKMKKVFLIKIFSCIVRIG